MSISEDEPKRFSIEQALHVLEQAKRFHPHTEYSIAVRKFNPGGLTAHQTVDVESMFAGIDWEARKIVVVPSKPLTELTPEQVAEISESVRKGSSWHAYQRERKAFEREKELKTKLAAAIALLKEAEPAHHPDPATNQRITAFLREAGQ